jgi:alkylhydroperoxidase family enzyme
VDIEDIIDEPLRHIADPSALPIRERLAVAYTKAVLADSNSMPDDLMAEIHVEFTDQELVELTFLVGYINLLNLFNNSLGVRYHGDYRARLDRSG